MTIVVGYVDWVLITDDETLEARLDFSKIRFVFDLEPVVGDIIQLNDSDGNPVLLEILRRHFIADYIEKPLRIVLGVVGEDRGEVQGNR